jgi:primosomal protein N'
VKTARKTVVAVELNCPYCGETIAAPGGSLYWEVNEFNVPLICFWCKKESKFPKI